jgi:ankyrin repeat protein
MAELNSFYDKFAIAMYEGNIEEAKQMFESETFSHNFYNFYFKTVKIFDKSIFFRACKKNKIELVKFLLNSDKISEEEDYYLKDKDDYIDGFNKASEKGNLEIVKLLIESDKSDNKFYNEYYYECMYRGFNFACYNGYIEIVKLFLESNKFSNDFYTYSNGKPTAFTDAVDQGHFEIVKILLESNKFSNEFYTNLDYFYGKAYFYRDGYGVINSLTYAVKQGKIKIVKLLLESDKFYKDFKIITDAFTIACEQGHLDIIKLLLESDQFSDNKYKLYLSNNIEKIKKICYKSERYDIIQLLENVLQNFPIKE